MTSSPTDTSENQSFFSKLRERSAIVFTIGLALSVASFVENLHMGKDAIAYVVAELSKIEGWVDVVQAVAAIFHGALEWWRGVLRDLFSFLPFHVPQWLHDPISVLFFGASRLFQAAQNYVRRDTEMDARERLHSGLVRYYSFVFQILLILALFIVPIVLLIFLDEVFYDSTTREIDFSRPIAPIVVLPYIAVLVIFAIAFLFVRRLAGRVLDRARQAFRHEAHYPNDPG